MFVVEVIANESDNLYGENPKYKFNEDTHGRDKMMDFIQLTIDNGYDCNIHRETEDE